MTEETFVLKIKAIFPHPPDGGFGSVRFAFTVPKGESVTIDIPYYSENGIDAGVKDAAGTLASFADALAERAKELAE